MGQLGGGPRRLACGVGPHDPLRVVLQGGRGGSGLEASHALRVGLELCQLLRRVHLHSSHGTRGGVDPRKSSLLLLWTVAGKAAKGAAWRHSNLTVNGRSSPAHRRASARRSPASSRRRASTWSWWRGGPTGSKRSPRSCARSTA